MAEVIRFHRSLYDAEAIQEAAAAYDRLATIELHVAEYDVRAHISDIDGRVKDRLVDAFCNHALFATIARHRAAMGTAEGLA